MSGKPRILLVGDSLKDIEEVLGREADSYELVPVQHPFRALAQLNRGNFDGVFVAPNYFREAFQIGKLLQNEQILEGMPDGVVLLDAENTILWCNNRLREWCHGEDVAGKNFYAAL